MRSSPNGSCSEFVRESLMVKLRILAPSYILAASNMLIVDY
jgi:hypothetical protein